VRVVAVARGSGSGKSSEVRGATLRSTTAERGCDGERGERQREVAKLGEQLSAVHVMASVVNGE